MDGKIYGKPSDRQEAIDFLVGFSDREHQVFTGVCLYSKDKQHQFSVRSDVKFALVTEADARHYFDTENPIDKAGAYGIQDNFGKTKVEWIKGSYTNIMGLPVAQVCEALVNF